MYRPGVHALSETNACMAHSFHISTLSQLSLETLLPVEKKILLTLLEDSLPCPSIWHVLATS